MKFFKTFHEKFRIYWPLIKSLQTALLLLTGFTGYISARSPDLSWQTILGLLGSLFLAVSGSTVLNMVYDRDIDARMERTARRPLPSGRVSTGEALGLGVVLSLSGLVWAFSLSAVYGAVVFAGLFFDVVVYTVWLKRRTAWSIVWGGISGGMPILAGRVLGVGRIDFIGVLLASAVLLWIPTHIMTFNMRHHEDYRRAGVPTFPEKYGFQPTRWIIALSCLGAAVAMAMGSVALGLSGGHIRLMVVLSVGILGVAVASLARPSERVNFGLFKYASMYMMGSMLMMILGVL